MAIDYKSVVRDKWKERLNWDQLPEYVQEAIGKFGLEMYGLGQHLVANIKEIKYDGRLVILDDGSRWEVDPVDSSTCEFWSEFTKVVIIDDEMYHIEDAEKVSVQKEQ